jgi:hypothetical protein
MLAAGQSELAYRTTVVQNNLSPQFGECVLVVTPPGASTLNVEVWDADGKPPASGGAPHPNDDIVSNSCTRKKFPLQFV